MKVLIEQELQMSLLLESALKLFVGKWLINTDRHDTRVKKI
jgi:hypothetical protein